MSTTVSIKELRAMQSDDLRKEVVAQETHVVKLRMGLEMGKDKDSAKYVREKRQLARMKTVMTEAGKKGQMIRKSEKKSSSEFSASPVDSSSSRKESSPMKS